MQISIRQYAQSLFEATSDKDGKALAAALKNFVVILNRDRVLNKASEIIKCFQEICDQATGEMAVEVTTARALNKSSQDLIVNYLKSRTDAKKINLSSIIDKSLIGGFILRYDSKVIDGSLKNSLVTLKNKISN